MFAALPCQAIASSPTLSAHTRIASPGDFESFSLRDGRTLAWHSFGDPNGKPLYFFHGFPSCRLLGSLIHESAVQYGIHIVAPDRPGFGRSTPHATRNIGGWADDVVQLANHLGHSLFGVLGASCGGPYALACAQRIPERLVYAGLMAGIGPMDQSDTRSKQLPLLRLLFALAYIHPALTGPILGLDARLFASHPERALDLLSGLLGQPDRQLLRSNATVRARLCASFVEAYRQGSSSARQEAGLISRFGSEFLRTVVFRIDIHQGGMDRHVPEAMGRHLARALPDASFHFYPDEGHLSILVNRFPDCAEQFISRFGDRV